MNESSQRLQSSKGARGPDAGVGEVDSNGAESMVTVLLVVFVSRCASTIDEGRSRAASKSGKEVCVIVEAAWIWVCSLWKCC